MKTNCGYKNKSIAHSCGNSDKEEYNEEKGQCNNVQSTHYRQLKVGLQLQTAKGRTTDR